MSKFTQAVKLANFIYEVRVSIRTGAPTTLTRLMKGKYLQLDRNVSFNAFPVYHSLTSHYPTMCYMV